MIVAEMIDHHTLHHQELMTVHLIIQHQGILIPVTMIPAGVMTDQVILHHQDLINLNPMIVLLDIPEAMIVGPVTITGVNHRHTVHHPGIALPAQIIHHPETAVQGIHLGAVVRAIHLEVAVQAALQEARDNLTT